MKRTLKVSDKTQLPRSVYNKKRKHHNRFIYTRDLQDTLLPLSVGTCAITTHVHTNTPTNMNTKTELIKKK